MADYAKMKNAELETLLKDRGLPHSGKKADLVKRLQDDDSEKAGAATTEPAKNEDEIDWDDEPATLDTKPTSEPAAAALAAGGQGQPPNPQAVPNQQPAIDPAKTNDLAVSDPAPAPETTSEAAPVPEPAQEPVKPAVDFSSGLAKTTIEQEIEKRKARAKKFGTDVSTDETLKSLERAQRFGGSDTPTDLPGRLNEALPERREKKRARDAPDDNAARKKGRPGPGGRKESGRNGGNKPVTDKPAGGNKGFQLSDADKAKAEARKAKFA